MILRPNNNCCRKPKILDGNIFRHCQTIGIALLIWSATAVVQAETNGPKTNDLTQLSIEALMEIDVPKVSSASKFEQKATEAPANVSVITADDIKLNGYRTLGDVLESVPGFNVSNDRNYSFLGSQGISLGDFNSRTLLLVDGHRVNNNLTDGAFIDTAFVLDMDLIDQVEIIQGPNAVLYGNNAFFGVINVVTRHGKELKGLEATAEVGSFDSYAARLSYGKSFTNGVEVLLSGSIYESAGSSQLFIPTFNTPAQNNGVASGLDADSAASAFASISYSDFILETAFNRRDKDNPTAQYFTTFDASGLETKDDRGYVNLKFTHEIPNIFDISAQAYYDYAEHSIGYPFGAHTFYAEQQRGQWVGAELQLSKRIQDKHIFTLGVEYRDDFDQNDRVYAPATGVVTKNTEQSSVSYGVYAEGDIALLDNIHLNSGARYDQDGNLEPTINPRAALIYEPLDKSSIKFIYGSAYRAPNFVELSDTQFKDIEPERIKSYDLVYDQGISRNLRASLSGFYNQMNNLIVFENGNYDNINASSQGIELALDGTFDGSVRGRLSYTLQKAKNQSQTLSLPDSPQNMLKFNLSVPVIKEKLFASIEIQYTSRRSTYFTTTTGQTMPGMDVNGYSVVNFTLFSKNLFKDLDISASIYNIFDQQYADPATVAHLENEIPQNGRSLRLKVNYRF